MKGQVFKRRWKNKAGEWVEARTYSIRFYHEGKHKWIGNFKTKREAERELVARVNQVHEGSYQEIRDITFSELCDKWLATKAACKPSTLAGYKAIVDHYLKCYFGERKISTIRQEDIKAYVAEMFSSSVLSARTIRASLIPLKAMLRHAVENSYLRRNPCVGLDKIEWQRKEMRFLSKEQLKQLLDAIREHHSEHYPFFLLLATTGVRRGEAFGLRWQDVDFTHSQIHIRQTAWKGQFGDPKTNKGKRTIPINNELPRELLELKVRQPLEIRKHNLVFPDSEGKAISNDSSLRRAFISALKLADLPRIRLHDLRHSFASHLIASGCSIKVAQDLLGHSTAAITLDLYCHTSEAEKREAIAALNF